MKTNVIVRMIFLLFIVSVLFLSGCKSYLIPEPGAVALEKARINLPEEGVQNALWKGKDLEIKYSISPGGEGLVISGTQTVDDSVTMSFPAVDNLRVKMTFLDDLGRVLGTADITPRYSSFSQADGPLDFKSVVVPPPGTSAFAFSYWGSFVGIPREVTESWDIRYFPFQ